MTTYRSKETIQAVQFQGSPLPGVTCDGSSLDKDTREAAKYAAGCDPSRAHHLHVHTQDTGGMKVLKPGDWIFPLIGGPWGTASDEKFRGHWEVPEVKTRPTIEELQKILDNEGDVPVIVHSDGSVSAPEPPVISATNSITPDLAAGTMIVPDAPIDHVEV